MNDKNYFMENIVLGTLENINRNTTRSKIFLGGTCNESTWRNELIEKLDIDYFNPVVDDWDEKAQVREIYEREHCDFVLYVITKEMTGVYSIAEVVDDSNKQPQKTLFCVLEDGFDKGQLRSLNSVKEMVRGNGAKVFNTLDDIANYVNHID